MAFFQKGKLGNYIRGGQTTNHYLSLIQEVTVKLSGFYFIVFCLCSTALFFYNSTGYQRDLTLTYGLSVFHYGVFKDADYVLNIKHRNGRKQRVKAVNLYRNPQVHAIYFDTKNILFSALYYALFCPLPFLYFYLRFLLSQGRHQITDEHIRGVTLGTPKEVQQQVNKVRKEMRQKKAKVRFCGFDIPRNFETQNFLLAGAPGSGKTGQIINMLHDIRKQKGRAIIYDRSGTFVEKFYRPGTDVILNPLDKRGADWDLFSECRTKYEFDDFASAFIPDARSSDPFWTLGPRAVFSAICNKESKKPHPSVEEMINIILQMPLETMFKYCKYTDAASVLSEGAEKTAASVRASMAVYVNCLRLLRERGSERFCIRDWVQNEEQDDSFIFITSNKENEYVLRPLITAYIHIATKSLLGLPESLERRIWCFYDELSTLKKLDILKEAPAETRKHGGCLVFGFQSYPQMLDIYGKAGVAALIGGCASGLITRSNESDFAKWSAEYVSQNETAKASENLSIGYHSVRDAINMSKTRSIQDVVIPAEFRALPDFTGFVVFGRGVSVTKVKLPYRELPKIHEGFVPCDDINEVAVPICEEDMECNSIGESFTFMNDSEINVIEKSPLAVDGTFGGNKKVSSGVDGQERPERTKKTSQLPTLDLDAVQDKSVQLSQEQQDQEDVIKRDFIQNSFDQEPDR